MNGTSGTIVATKPIGLTWNDWPLPIHAAGSKNFHMPMVGFNVIGDFYRFCDDAEAFYLRLDDDVVFVEDGFFQKFMARVMAERGSAIWYAPLIINNAICNS